jgi:omega-amidase
MKIALCQLLCGDDKKENIKTAEKAVTRACANGANIVALPECWNSPYDTSAFPKYAETIPLTAQDVDLKQNPSTAFMIETAK